MGLGVREREREGERSRIIQSYHDFNLIVELLLLLAAASARRSRPKRKAEEGCRGYAHPRSEERKEDPEGMDANLFVFLVNPTVLLPPFVLDVVLEFFFPFS